MPSRNKLVVNEKAAYVWDHTWILLPQGLAYNTAAAAPRALERTTRSTLLTRASARGGSKGRGARLWENVLPYIEERARVL